MNINNEKPLVSIITVCYNSEKYIRDTIKSVLNQTYDNIEYIIVDGQSTDSTLDIIKEYESKFNGRMRWISELDEGIYDAMNKGIDMANGEIIGIINSDDWYENEAVEIIVEKFQTSKPDIVYGNINHIREFDKELYCKIDKSTKDLEMLKKHMFIHHPTLFVKNNIYNELSKYNTDFDIAGDWDFVSKCYSRDKEFEYLDVVIANFRYGGISSKFDLNYIIERFKVIRENFSLTRAYLNFLKELVLLFKHKCIKFILPKKLYSFFKYKQNSRIIKNDYKRCSK